MSSCIIDYKIGIFRRIFSMVPDGKRYYLFAIALFLPFVSILSASDGVPLIIDTDMGLDDIRAVLVLINSPEVSIKAITTVSGSARAEVGAENMARLLSHFGVGSIPVASFSGKPVAGTGKPPFWREKAESMGGISLLKIAEVKVEPDGDKLLREVLSKTECPVTIVALGPLTNIARFISKNKDLQPKIKEIIFYGGNLEEPEHSFNISFDRTAFINVFKKDIKLRVIGFSESDKGEFPGFFSAVSGGEEYAAPLIRRMFSDDEMKRHLQLSDELVPLFLIRPDTFQSYRPRWVADPSCRLYFVPRKELKDELIGTLASRLSHLRSTSGHRHYVGVIRLFPEDSLLPDVKKISPLVISRHGRYEWESVMLLNELHQHFGAYSIVGVKMGIYALEILKAAPEEVMVVSEAGSKPPVSCFSDGIMVATGASPGRGLIRVEEKGIPASRFYYQGEVLRLELLPCYRRLIRKEIKRLIDEYGDLSPDYFRGLRRFSLKLLCDFDRKRIFKVEYLINE
jgi:pyrimidine-specific ribonucleoside hydrolase